MLDYLQDDDSRAERPFFAYLPFSVPRWPLQAHPEDIAKYKGVYDEGPEILRQKRLAKIKELGLVGEDATIHPVLAKTRFWDSLTEDEKQFSARTMEVYAAMVDRMDQNIGRVIKHLKQTDQYDNTIIIILSDNGAEGAQLEALPVFGPDIETVIAKYYDNSLDNVGKGNSYFGTVSIEHRRPPRHLVYIKHIPVKVEFVHRHSSSIRASHAKMASVMSFNGDGSTADFTGNTEYPASGTAI